MGPFLLGFTDELVKVAFVSPGQPAGGAPAGVKVAYDPKVQRMESPKGPAAPIRYRPSPGYRPKPASDPTPEPPQKRRRGKRGKKYRNVGTFGFESYEDAQRAKRTDAQSAAKLKSQKATTAKKEKFNKH